MNKPFNSRIPLKNITRKEAMAQMEGGQEDLMNYDLSIGCIIPEESAKRLGRYETEEFLKEAFTKLTNIKVGTEMFLNGQSGKVVDLRLIDGSIVPVADFDGMCVYANTVSIKNGKYTIL